MRTRTIGTEQVSAIGLGEMQLSLADRPDEAQGVRTIHAALDAGVTLIDTADAYCADGSEMGHGERLTAKALSSYRRHRARAGGHQGRPHPRRRAAAGASTAPPPTCARPATRAWPRSAWTRSTSTSTTAPTRRSRTRRRRAR